MPEDIEKNLSPAEAPGPEREPVLEKEKPSAPEKAPAKEAPREPVLTTPVAPAAPAPQAPTPADPITESVEKILSEDLAEFYQAMPPADRERFKIKGEETVSKIRKIMDGATIKVKEVLKLIVIWIKMIPGINKFFLEQESKIKTDKIIDLHRRMRGE
jgi:hypothetical protein